MAAIDTSARIRASVADAIGKQCMGDDIGFDVAPMVPVVNGQPAGVLYRLFFTKRSPLLGQGPLMNISQVAAADPSDAQILEAVTTALRELRELAAKLLAPQN